MIPHFILESQSFGNARFSTGQKTAKKSFSSTYFFFKKTGLQKNRFIIQLPGKIQEENDYRASQ
jgi:hypothetical protein